MSALEWPPGCAISAGGRHAIQAEHDQQERARAARRHHQPPARSAPPPAASASQLAALAKRVAALERFNREILPDGIGKALADLHRQLDARPLDPEAVKDAVGAAMAQLHAGIWRADKAFPMGSLTTHDGSLWLARAGSTGVRPGSGAGCWQLIVKGHRPGKKENTR